MEMLKRNKWMVVLIIVAIIFGIWFGIVFDRHIVGARGEAIDCLSNDGIVMVKERGSVVCLEKR